MKRYTVGTYRHTAIPKNPNARIQENLKSGIIRYTEKPSTRTYSKAQLGKAGCALDNQFLRN